jgi:hypothetical protein
MNKPFYPRLIDLSEVAGSTRVVEVDANGAQRVVEILETTGETISDEACRPLRTRSNVIPFAASLRRVS